MSRPANGRARIQVADCAVRSNNRHLPGKDAWLVCEWRSTGGHDFYLNDLSSRTSPRVLAAAWVCWQAHRQSKGELGAGHFEGRSWACLHRHALMTCLAFACRPPLRPAV